MKIFEENIRTILNFFSNHFELILYINLTCIIIGVILFLTVQLSDVTFRSRLYTLIINVFLASMITAESCMLVLSICVYWVNYQPTIKERKFVDQIVLTTQWVQFNAPLYYIDGNILRSRTINTRQEKEIFKATNPLREYHFSPNGKYLLAVSLNELYLLDMQRKESQIIDSLSLNQNQPPRGTIRGVRWAPDSQKFCYETSLWTPFSSQEHSYVYILSEQRKLEIKSPSRRVSSLYWDQSAENLYYIYNEAQDKSVSTYPYKIKVFQIPIQRQGQFVVSPEPKLVTKILYDKALLPLDHLKIKGIELFLKADELSFERLTHKSLFAAPAIQFEPSINLKKTDSVYLRYQFLKEVKDFLNAFVLMWKKDAQIKSLELSQVYRPMIMSIVSQRGKVLGIDNDDYLYYIHKKWFKKRLFKIPREPVVSDAPYYPYKGGEPVIYNIRWLPSGRYAILEHKYMGVFILDPYTSKVGHIVGLQGEAIGWFANDQHSHEKFY